MACRELLLADTPRTRLLGLLGRDALAPGVGLLIRPSSGVHTFGMRFPIDVVALDCNSRVLATWQAVPPWRVRGLGFKTSSVLELGAGEARQAGIDVGDLLTIAPQPDSRVKGEVTGPEAERWHAS